jgi:hypothetical protein
LAQLRQVELRRVVHGVQQPCRVMDACEHILGRDVTQEADYRAILVCLLAWGTHMGLGRRDYISDIGDHTLAATAEPFLGLETRQEANDRVSHAIAERPIVRPSALGDTRHSRSDGQQGATRLHTIKARHSPTYVGLPQGGALALYETVQTSLDGFKHSSP